MTTSIDIEEFSIITEGKSSILFPKTNAVFYNNVQQFNRDMSVAAIRTWSESFLEEKEKKARKKHYLTRPIFALM
jgi:tRNA (guanine26-N2/guanine27-N2)-dimethyltransferase